MIEEKKEIEVGEVKIANVAMHCMNCRSGSQFDLQNVKTHPDFIFCKLWGELKFHKGVCPNFG